LSPGALDQALQLVPPAPANARVLVGNATHDDAGVFLLRDDLAIVQTVDFFTPVVDEPRTFGAVAAANALSDVYAMGGEPLTALALSSFPAELPPRLLGEILAGGQEVMDAAGVAILGGHTVDDKEPKMGYAVTGQVDVAHIWRNSTAVPGDVLYLTKPVGSGVVVKAIKDQRAEPAWEEAAIRMMTETNRAARDLVRDAVGDPSACTDITGFGLLGHAWEMAWGSGVALRLRADAVPLLPGAAELARQDGFPAGSRNNYAYVAPHLEAAPSVPDWLRRLLADAVTSGGLLLAVAPTAAARLEAEAARRGQPLFRIGTVDEGPPRVILW
jgi:selenide,water dikinase